MPGRRDSEQRVPGFLPSLDFPFLRASDALVLQDSDNDPAILCLPLHCGFPFAKNIVQCVQRPLAILPMASFP